MRDIKTSKFLENCILKNCYEDMFESSAFKPNDKLNWGCKIRDILCKYGFNHVLGCSKIHLSILYSIYQFQYLNYVHVSDIY
jgi:hypothetical protein